MGLAIEQIVARFADVGEARITAAVSDRIARAHLLDGDAYLLALDWNARLVTTLRTQGIWPKRYRTGRWRP
jgi:hypothetical protein